MRVSSTRCRSMKRGLFIQAGMATALVAIPPFFIAARARYTSATGQKGINKRHKLVIQISDNDPAKWNLALNNAKNVLDDVGAANVDIEIVGRAYVVLHVFGVVEG